MYAVVISGGKQYRVEPGSTLIVERLAADAGSTITFDRVLLVGDGDAITVGTPTVSGATVSGTVIGEELGPKIVIFKYKQKVKYRRRTGHRQHHTRIRIDGITANGRTESAPEEEKKAVKAKAPKVAKATAKAKAKPKVPAKRAGAAASKEKKAAPKPRASASTKAAAAKSKPKADTDKAPAKRATTRRSPAAKKDEAKE